MRKYLFVLSIFLTLSYWGYAQSVTIYRAGLATAPTYTTIKAAVANSIALDSLVLSADTFREQNILIDKSLKLKGTSSSIVKTTIDPGMAADSSILKFINPDFPADTRTLTLSEIDFTNGKANNGLDSGGGAIFAGKGTVLYLNGNLEFTNNTAPDSSTGFVGSGNGGAIYSEGEVSVTDYNIFFKGNNAVNGGAIYSKNLLKLYNLIEIYDNTASQNGGAIYTSGILQVSGKSKISINNAGNGGAIYARNAELYINSGTYFALNHSEKLGGVLCMENTYCRIADSTEMYSNKTDSNIAAAIYCSGNNDIQIYGADITYNRSTNPLYNGLGMAIYNDVAPGASSIIRINNSRIFNPKPDNTRQNEYYNAQAISAFISDSTWWGESDTTGLIYNAAGATVAMRSWAVCEWILNNGLPIGKSSSFPLEAYFTLNTGAALPPNMLWMIGGTFFSDSGNFAPSIAYMNASNIVGSIFTVPDLTGPVILNGLVDADSFVKSIYVQGLDIQENKLATKKLFSIYPNPATDVLFIKQNDQQKGLATITIKDITGRTIIDEKLNTQNNTTSIPLVLKPGYYFVTLIVAGKPLQIEKLQIQ
ncbi:MAG: T9SS type A sorting domain-containing protein [Chitinophagaceae bacterium]|nr:T9SS type A sorting domain-containing protein [Chitinophagaceae bacterium]